MNIIIKITFKFFGKTYVLTNYAYKRELEESEHYKDNPDKTKIKIIKYKIPLLFGYYNNIKNLHSSSSVFPNLNFCDITPNDNYLVKRIF